MSTRIELYGEGPRWWSENIEASRHHIDVRWGGEADRVTCRLGTLDVGRAAFHFDPGDLRAETGAGQGWDEVFGVTGHPIRQFLGKVLTVAGWHRPLIDPATFRTLAALRHAERGRVEFICDTNALNEGVAHWLVALFADRCDIVTTSVTSSELQDHWDGASFGSVPPPKGRGNRKWLQSRFSALTAYRLRESSGFSRVLWRDLDVDDTALLLARGDAKGGKSSRADTMMLRAVRRAINDRVQGLERFFVTGDTGLARRASSELPAGRVIAAKVADLRPGACYVPADWWPGADQGYTLAQSHPLRLIWSLLGFADEVALSIPGADPRFVFSAYNRDMWPSDYALPWLNVQGDSKPIFAPPPPPEPETDRQPFLIPLPEEPAPRVIATAGVEEPLFPPVKASAVEPFYRYMQVGGHDLLTIIAALGRGQLPAADSKLAGLPGTRARGVMRVIEALRLARFVEGTADAADHTALLRAAWSTGSTDQIAALWRPYTPFDRVAAGATRIDGVSDRVVQTVRPLVRALGQLVEYDGVWYPGGAFPTVARARAAVLAATRRAPTLTVARLWTEVCLRDLHIAPSRVTHHWGRFRDAVLFDFHWRTGGTPRKDTIQDALRIEDGRMRSVSIPLDHHETIREFYQVAR